MLPTLIWILSGLCVLAIVIFITAVIATAVHVRQRRPETIIEFPPVSIVKPMKGVDDSLATNLESFFTLRYPAPLEIVFACADPADPANVVAREVATRHPHVQVKFVRSDQNVALNPKFASLAGALAEVSYDLIFQTDANVRVASDHLTRIVSEFIGSAAGLLSSLIVGTGERSVGAALDNLHLTAVIAPSVAFASRIGRRAVVVGKALMYRNGELRALGGIGQFKNVLAEDYLMGERYAQASKRVMLSSATVENVNERTTVKAFVARHSRWLKMNAVINPTAFTLRFLISPVWAFPLLILGWGNLVAQVIGFSTFAVFLAGQQVLFRVLRREWMGLRLMLLSLVDAVLMWAVWPYSAVSRSINWRGKRLVLGPHTTLRSQS